MIKVNMLNFGHYRGGVDIFTKLLKNELERHFKVDVKLNNKNYGMFDIIHNHNPYNPILSSILTLHTFNFDYRYEKAVFNSVDNSLILTTVSKYAKKKLRELYGFKTRVIYNFSDMLNYPIKLYPKHKLTIGYIGRLDKKKGIEDLIRLAVEHKNINVVLCGYDMYGYSKLKINNLKVIEHIENREQLAKIIDMFDISVYPTYEDVNPISLIDCIFRKKIVLVRNIESLREFKKCYWFFEDYNELKELIFYDYSINELENKFKNALKLFNPLENVYKYYKLYNICVEG